MTRSRFLSFMILCLLLVGIRPATAERFHVRVAGGRVTGPSAAGDWSGPNCYPSLVAAAAAAAPGDSILLSRETHPLDEVVSLAGLLADGRFGSEPLGATLALTECSGMIVTGEASVRVQGVTVAGVQPGRDRPALAVTGVGTDLTLAGCDFVDLDLGPSDWPGGAAVAVAGPGNLDVHACRFDNNRAEGRGGAVHLGAGLTATFASCEFSDNVASTRSPRGGAVFVAAASEPSWVEFRDCSFERNTSGGPGGAMSCQGAAVTVIGGDVIGNRSGVENRWTEGAGLHFRRDDGGHTESVAIAIEGVVFESNRGAFDPALVAGDGGAVFTSGVADRVLPVTVEDCLFRDNFNDQGSGVYVSRWSEGAVRRCRFYDNVAYHHAGGVMKGGHFHENAGETLEIDTCLFVRNRAGFDDTGQDTGAYARGGAICCRMFPRVVVRHCTFVDNVVNTSGYKFGDAFAHYFEYDSWQPGNLCVLQNCVFWGEGGNHVQAYCDDGGMEDFSHCAAAAGEIDMGGLIDPSPIILSSAPFSNLESGFPTAGGPLVDSALDLGFAIDLDGRAMPHGAGPDIGCFEWYDVTDAPETPPASPRLTAGPNPFNPRTVLAGRLPAAGRVRLALYDARGRRVRVLCDAVLPAGEHRWTWDGRDHGGRDCATGVYLARLVVDGRPGPTRKLTLVR